jgi:hypothetical protein
MRSFGNETGQRQPSSVNRWRDFFMSMEEHAAHTDPKFSPEDVEFLGFIGGWNCYVGVDTF